MSVLVFAESIENKFHKPTLEALTYAADTAAKLGTEVTALVMNQPESGEVEKLARYGANKVLIAKSDALKDFNTKAYAKVVAQAAEKSNADVIIFTGTFNGKALAPRVSARMKAGLITGVISLPEKTAEGLVVKKPVYSGKGFGHFAITSAVRIISIGINSHHVAEKSVTSSTEEWTPTLEATDTPVEVKEVKREKGKVSLTEAELVVSGGRGMKGPDNWGMLEELADLLGAATACSKPVSDVHWRPHSEHVGQTGLTISPNLYIAVGISGAVQHLAGVSSSKVICVINKDPEAPFFKAADYGIVGDAFDVVPKLVEAAKRIKSAS